MQTGYGKEQHKLLLNTSEIEYNNNLFIFLFMNISLLSAFFLRFQLKYFISIEIIC